MSQPVILLGGFYQFAAGQVLHHPCVSSRMLMWCRQGQGEAIIDGQRRQLSADHWLLMPWHHRVEYRADRRRPFLIGGIHLCPEHDPGPVELRVPHNCDDRLHAATNRRDVRWTGLDGLPEGDFAEHPGLRRLAEYIAERWTAGTIDTDQAQAMGRLLRDELLATATRLPATGLPAALTATIQAARSDLSRPLDLAALARMSGCSPATLVRLFRTHLDRSPMAWLRSERIETARRLLLSTALPVAAIGARVGITDKHRLAKLFSTATGRSPRQWRQHQEL